MKLYTKQGDQGRTQLLSGERVEKSHARVAAYGQVDELNATIGWVICACDDKHLSDRLRRVQERLFVLGAELADAGQQASVPRTATADVQQLETWIDEACAATSELKSFILPGGSEAAARLHLARTVCRRAEREVVGLIGDSGAQPILPLIFLNRLSDLLFAWARWVNAEAGVGDIQWQADKTGP